MLEFLQHLLRSAYDPEALKELVRTGGAPLVCTIVFIETGFFVGFFLPGDSLLITAGIFAAADVIPLKWLLLPVMLCAIVGDQIGYWIGRSAGPALYKREDSLFFRRSHLQRAHEFYEKYGGRAVILARFVPIVRTFCPPVSGAAQNALCALRYVRHRRRHCLGFRHGSRRLLPRQAPFPTSARESTTSSSSSRSSRFSPPSSASCAGAKPPPRARASATSPTASE